MAIAVDATSSASAITAPLAFNHTVSGADRVLLVGIAGVDSADVSAITFNGVSLTKAVEETSGYGENSIWYLLNPDTGTHSISIARANNSEAMSAAGISFTGAGGVSGTGINHAYSATASVATTTNRTVGYVVSALFWEVAAGIVTYTGGGTQFATEVVGAHAGLYTYQAFSGGANITETWTKTGGSQPYAASGLEVYETSSFVPKVMMF